MKLGAVLPQNEIGDSPNDLTAFAQGVEKLGFDYLLAYDHIVGLDPVDHPEQKFIFSYRDGFHEPLTTFSFLAGQTTDLEFVTGILILPQRNTALVAKQAAQLWMLSKGRFRLGVGGGWNRPEMEALGFDFTNRGQRMDEQLELMEKLWSQPLVEFEGRFHRIQRAGLNPRPTHRLPVWVGGYAPAVLRRAARFGDGWMPATLPAGKERELIERLRQELEKAGRQRPFGIDVRTLYREGRSGWKKTWASWHDLGVTHLRFNTMGAGFDSVSGHLEGLEEIRDFFINEGKLSLSSPG